MYKSTATLTINGSIEGRSEIITDERVLSSSNYHDNIKKLMMENGWELDYGDNHRLIKGDKKITFEGEHIESFDLICAERMVKRNKQSDLLVWLMSSMLNPPSPRTRSYIVELL